MATIYPNPMHTVYGPVNIPFQNIYPREDLSMRFNYLRGMERTRKGSGPSGPKSAT